MLLLWANSNHTSKISLLQPKVIRSVFYASNRLIFSYGMPCLLWGFRRQRRYAVWESTRHLQIVLPAHQTLPELSRWSPAIYRRIRKPTSSCRFEICRHHKHRCRMWIAQDYDQHQCRFELFDYISPGTVELSFSIADIAFFSIAFGLDEPYCKVEATAELDELQHALGLSMELLWERLAPCAEQQDLMVQIIDNFLSVSIHLND